MLAFLTYWVIIQVFGLAALPLARRVFSWLPDRGYAFSKTVGLLLVSYLLWLGASTGLLINNAGGVTFALLVVAGLSAWLALRGSSAPIHERVKRFWECERGRILLVEALFLLSFAGWAVVRAYAPDKILPAGGEKYMEIGFLNGVLNSPRFPPLDPWLAGYGISYYYFGYVMMGVMTTASATAPGVSFDLYDALLFALTAVTAFGIVENMVRAAKGSAQAAGAFGLLGALFVGMLGNLQGLVEGLYHSRALPMSFFEWLNIPDLAGTPQSGSFYPGGGWWWWRASRVIRDLDLNYQPVIFQPIDEFPFFSFLLGDNHPHKLGLPFVLLAIGLALHLLLRQSARSAAAQPEEGQTGWQRWKAGAGANAQASAEVGWFLFAAVTLGSLGFLNTWDFPIYLGVLVLADAAGRWWAGEQRSVSRVLLRAMALGAGLGAASIALYIFFYLSFSSQAGGVLPYLNPPTRLAQYFVMFGPFLIILAFFAPLAAWQAYGGKFPLADALYNWLWTAALILGTFLVALALGAAAVSLLGLNGSPMLQNWMGGLSLGEGLAQTLRSRLTDPWLFLVLTALLALAITAALHARARAAAIVDAASADAASVVAAQEAQTDLTALPQVAEPGAERIEDRPSLEPAAVFALVLAFIGIALTLVVEFFFLRDNFGARMNTVFKFYFQGWVLMAVASAFGAWWVLARARSAALRGVFAVTAALLVAAGLVYPIMATYSRAGEFGTQPTLDASASFSGFYGNHWAAQPDDWAAILWLRQNGRGQDGSVPVILEAGAGGYENAGRVSAFTGFPTLLGWTNHEGQWRGGQEEINERAPVISEIYTTPFPQLALERLRAWNVRFIVVGEAERQYINRQCQQIGGSCNPTRALAKFEQGDFELVFQQGNISVYRVPYPPQP